MIDPMTVFSLRKSINARISLEAKRRGALPNEIRKQYVFSLFFKRLFARGFGHWMLLGGNALLIRTGGGRFTQDIDLARDDDWDGVEELHDEFQESLRSDDANDPFYFDILRIESRNDLDIFGYGAHTAKAHIRIMLGAKEFDTFTVDITTRRHVDGPVDRIPLKPIIDHQTLNDMPYIPTVPVENHLADKICALYERHGATGSSASTRYRDLADIVRIVKTLSFCAERLSKLIDHETMRRQIARPSAMISPDPGWEQKYPDAARYFAEFPSELRSLSSSLTVAASCLNDVLDGTRTTGVWDPLSQAWN